MTYLKKATSNLNKPMPIDDDEESAGASKRAAKSKRNANKNTNGDDAAARDDRDVRCRRQVRLSSDFHVFNLNDALTIVDDMRNYDAEHVAALAAASASSRHQHQIPAQMFELIVKSPVFYNTRLLPNCRFKYQSHFKRSQFSDTDKM